MRRTGSGEELMRRRHLAVARVAEGHSQKEVAAFLGVHPGSVSRWVCAHRREGPAALQGHDASGRPPKLTPRQEKAVLSWVSKSPTGFGYADELWTSKRLAALIEKRFGVRFNSNYLVEWLSARKHSPQKPARKALERDEAAIETWLAQDWPRIQKKPGTKRPTSCSSTRAAFS